MRSCRLNVEMLDRLRRNSASTPLFSSGVRSVIETRGADVESITNSNLNTLSCTDERFCDEFRLRVDNFRGTRRNGENLEEIQIGCWSIYRIHQCNGAPTYQQAKPCPAATDHKSQIVNL